MHLVGFIIRIYHDTRSPERQIPDFGHSLLQIYLQTKLQLSALWHQMFFIQNHILFSRAMTQVVSKQTFTLKAWVPYQASDGETVNARFFFFCNIAVR